VKYVGDDDVHARLATDSADVSPQIVISSATLDRGLHGMLHVRLDGVDDPIVIPVIITPPG
jgi:hypothetical protein